MMSSTEIIFLCLFVLVIIWALMLLQGRADCTISIAGFSGKKLREKFNASRVRWIKAVSVILFAGSVLYNVFVPNRIILLIGLVILVISDPVMLMCKKKDSGID